MATKKKTKKTEKLNKPYIGKYSVFGTDAKDAEDEAAKVNKKVGIKSVLLLKPNPKPVTPKRFNAFMRAGKLPRISPKTPKIR